MLSIKSIFLSEFIRIFLRQKSSKNITNTLINVYLRFEINLSDNPGHNPKSTNIREDKIRRRILTLYQVLSNDQGIGIISKLLEQSMTEESLAEHLGIGTEQLRVYLEQMEDLGIVEKHDFEGKVFLKIRKENLPVEASYLATMTELSKSTDPEAEINIIWEFFFIPTRLGIFVEKCFRLLPVHSAQVLSNYVAKELQGGNKNVTIVDLEDVLKEDTLHQSRSFLEQLKADYLYWGPFEYYDDKLPFEAHWRKWAPDTTKSIHEKLDRIMEDLKYYSRLLVLKTGSLKTTNTLSHFLAEDDSRFMVVTAKRTDKTRIEIPFDTPIVQYNERENVCYYFGSPEKLPSSESVVHWIIHNSLLDNGLDYKVVVHTHSPNLVMNYAWRGKALEVNGKTVPCIGWIKYGTPELGKHIANALRMHKTEAVIVEAHGLWVVSNDFERAIIAAENLEEKSSAISTCPYCGASIPKDFKFCGSCGRALESPKCPT